MDAGVVPPPRSLIGRITAIFSTFLAGHSHSVTEMSRLTGLPVSTMHRIAADLALCQLLERTEDGRFQVGLVMRQLGSDSWSRPRLTERGPRVLKDLSDATCRRARLGVLDEGRVSYIEKRVGSELVTSFGAPATLPAHASALGKALLAFTTREAVTAVGQRMTAFTANTLYTAEALMRNLEVTRLTGVAVAHGELVVGDSAVAVPVFGAGGVVAAALELKLDNPRTDLEMCRAALLVAARGLSRELVVDGEQLAHRGLRLLPASSDS
jgi:DNA-binding IclR family transcriptional regulator